MSTWIKVGTSVHSKPEVLGIARECGLGIDAVVGKLIRMWSWFDEMSVSGHVSYGTNVWLDSFVGHEGFAQACVKVGWLESTPDGLTMPNFDRHNGESSKKRLTDAARKRKSRSSQVPESDKRPQNVREMSHEKCDQIREDKIREETTTTLSDKSDGSRSPSKAEVRFSQFWSFYPRKIGKGKAWAVFKRLSSDDQHEAVEQAEAYAQAFDMAPDARKQFFKHPTTWLNGRCWEDDHAEWELLIEGK